MAFEYEDLRAILPALAGLESKKRLLILGDAVFQVEPSAYVQLASEANLELASAPSSLDPFTFGQSLGFARTDTLDANGRASIAANLNDSISPDLTERFDCVIDAGVLFWCFDPAAVFKNILQMARPGGVIAHITAVSGHYGRGYYNVHPLAFEDFYLLNGCKYLGASFRPKFHAGPLLGRVLRRLGIGNKLTSSPAPGSAYLRRASLNSIEFGDSFREPRESNLLPNNVLGVLLFRKGPSGDVKLPVRTSLYTREEATARRRQQTELSGLS